MMEKKLYFLESRILQHLMNGVEDPIANYKYNTLLQKYFYGPVSKNKHSAVLYKTRKHYTASTDIDKRIDLLQKLIIIHKDLKKANPKKYKYVKEHKNSNYHYVIKKYFSLKNLRFGSKRKQDVIDLTDSPETQTTTNSTNSQNFIDLTLDDQNNNDTNVMPPPINLNKRQQDFINEQNNNKRARYNSNANNSNANNSNANNSNANNSNANTSNANNSSANNSNANVVAFTSRYDTELVDYFSDPENFDMTRVFRQHNDDFIKDCGKPFFKKEIGSVTTKLFYENKTTRHIFKCLLVADFDKYSYGEPASNIVGEVLIHKVLYEILQNYTGNDKICKIPNIYDTFLCKINKKIFAVIEMEDAGKIYHDVISVLPSPSENILETASKIFKTLNFINTYVEFVHGDFKLDNLCYNHHTNDYYIIDFGFSYLKYKQNTLWLSKWLYEEQGINVTKPYRRDIIFYMYHLLAKITCDNLQVNEKLKKFIIQIISKFNFGLTNTDCGNSDKLYGVHTYLRFYSEKNDEVDNIMNSLLNNDVQEIKNIISRNY